MFLALAFIALAIKVLVPPGFMVANQGAGALPLVICTGHGPLTLDLSKDKAPGGKASHDAPCAFAGHGAAPTPTSFAPVSAPFAIATSAPTLLAVDVAPGRGLAAPPPPSRGPPVLPI